MQHKVDRGEEADPSSPDTEPRWLTPDEHRAWVGLAAVNIRLGQALDGQLRRDADMSHLEYMVLVVLSEADGRRRRMSTLAALIGSSLPRLSQLIQRFETRGWVERCTDPDDGRYTLACITDDGMTKLTAAAPGHVEAVRSLVFDSLSADQVHELDRICSAILHAIDPDQPRLDEI